MNNLRDYAHFCATLSPHGIRGATSQGQVWDIVYKTRHFPQPGKSEPNIKWDEIIPLILRLALVQGLEG